ncbi:unnamed protein product [Timema podura]|uniref:Uncharacterized protein n=1 Tax=Timema podura TaxID=61482 RepID=A0ABN7NS56_TIMPD|nr:unnamed protein product [Timema podura]
MVQKDLSADGGSDLDVHPVAPPPFVEIVHSTATTKNLITMKHLPKVAEENAVGIFEETLNDWKEGIFTYLYSASIAPVPAKGEIYFIPSIIPLPRLSVGATGCKQAQISHKTRLSHGQGCRPGGGRRLSNVLAVVEVLKSLIKFFEELREQFDSYAEKALEVCETKTYE